MTQTLPNDNKDNGRKRFKRIFIIIVIILITSAIGVKYYISDQLKPVSHDIIEEKSVVIPKGSSTLTIAEILKQNNLIRNEYVFRLVSKIEGKEEKYKAGKYIFSNGMSQREIMDKLVEGGISKDTITFTIPEGFELKQIAERLESKGLVDKERFLELCSKVSNFSSEFDFLKEVPSDHSLEGYLYPDTYEVYIDVKEEDIIRKMLNKFDNIYTDDIRNKAHALNMDINQVITLASIIEREGMVDEERALISGVFHNRIKKGRKLESCATVQYILGERKENLTEKDTRIESEYNTYLHKGLPPGPIASPGIKSIQAAVDPEDTDYLFFVANGDGTHTFTRTYQEHLNAKNKIRK